MKLTFPSLPTAISTACATLLVATSPLHAGTLVDAATDNVVAARSAIAGSGASDETVQQLEDFFTGARKNGDFTSVGSLRQRQALKAALVELRGARAEEARLEAEAAKPKKCFTSLAVRRQM